MGVRIDRKVLFFAGVLLLATATLSWAAGPAPGSKGISKGITRGGIRGSPALKRGVELGWDKGYLAGKIEVKQGLAPDPSRHDDYNDPEKWYRYEFGRRSSFMRGFRGGFLKGYSHALQQKVRYKAPVESNKKRYAGTSDAAMTAPGASIPVVQAFVPRSRSKKAKSRQKKAKTGYSMVISDAL